MKASLKFREDQKPLFRAKVPINVLGLPFQSGVVAGESKELTLSLASFFDSGPSLKLAYRPNDSWNPFSLIVKTGSGPFGSPNSSSMMMTAEFNMLGRGNPSFFLHFKPRFGDFCIKKSQSSAFVNHILKSEPNGVVSDEEDGTVEVVEKSEGYFPVNGVFSGNKIGVSPSEGVSAAGVINGLFSGVDLSANTVLPMRKGAVLSFRWGLRVPAEVKTALTENGAKRRHERVAGSEKKATAIPQSSMNLCDPSTVDRTRRKVRSRDGKRRDVKSVKKRRPQALPRSGNKNALLPGSAVTQSRPNT